MNERQGSKKHVKLTLRQESLEAIQIYSKADVVASSPLSSITAWD